MRLLIALSVELQMSALMAAGKRALKRNGTKITRDAVNNLGISYGVFDISADCA